jgi:hypothetical protein
MGASERRRVFHSIAQGRTHITKPQFLKGSKRWRFLLNVVSQYDEVPFPVDPATYSYHKSTEENYASEDMYFYGDFADIRAQLDYSWHRNYTKQRQLFQDQLVRNCVRRTYRQVHIDSNHIVAQL